MLTDINLEDFLCLRLPESDTQDILSRLTPEHVTEETFTRLLQTMQAKRVSIPHPKIDVIDCCGTGGSGLSHYNTSTTVAFVLAAGGVPVVKFGNRAMTSLSGSFDFLEHLGIPTEIDLNRIPDYLSTLGVVFLFAPQCYPSLKGFSALRRRIGKRTVFNFMGPLLNPVKPAYRLLGISHPKMQQVVADYLAQHTQTRKALVVHGENGLDEMDVSGSTRLLEVTGNTVVAKSYKATFTGDTPSPDTPLSPQDNLVIFHRLITGEDTTSYYHRLVCLNAGAGFYTVGKASTLEEGGAIAADLLRNRAVTKVLERCRRVYAP